MPPHRSQRSDPTQLVTSTNRPPAKVQPRQIQEQPHGHHLPAWSPNCTLSVSTTSLGLSTILPLTGFSGVDGGVYRRDKDIWLRWTGRLSIGSISSPAQSPRYSVALRSRLLAPTSPTSALEMIFQSGGPMRMVLCSAVNAAYCVGGEY